MLTLLGGHHVLFILDFFLFKNTIFFSGISFFKYNSKKLSMLIQLTLLTSLLACSLHYLYTLRYQNFDYLKANCDSLSTPLPL